MASASAKRFASPYIKGSGVTQAFLDRWLATEAQEAKDPTSVSHVLPSSCARTLFSLSFSCSISSMRMGLCFQPDEDRSSWYPDSDDDTSSRATNPISHRTPAPLQTTSPAPIKNTPSQSQSPSQVSTDRTNGLLSK